MIAQLIAALLAAAKTSQAVDGILDKLLSAYIAWKLEANRNDENAKNARNALAVAAAGKRVLNLCPGCPFGPGDGGRQHGATDAAPAVSAGGASGA